MAAVVRPSERVASRRRRAFLWLPLLVAGALVSLAGGPMITVFNSLDTAGLALMVGGLVGFIREVEK
ncbi:hypothetical protein SAMN04489740_0973 [Arthrobacter alpinus]|uniref:DUF7322 domain-containing protein n=1 Tax=Arthrobacter alpinus TaxID=656366 RepID=A0A1H5HBI3_9MICC|nr:hypothetical protein SAMN04489740_0973 [Arthrobacter alpinus]